jgi:hypothetical protein
VLDYACRAARLRRGRRGVGRRRAGQAYFSASGWSECTGPFDARAVALALWALASGGGVLGAVEAGTHGAQGSLCAALQAWVPPASCQEV